MIVIVLAAAFTAVLTIIIVQTYLRRAAHSYELASEVWGTVYRRADGILAGRYPAPVKAMAYGLAHTAGCGCYVRQMLLRHYLPSVATAREQASSKAPPSALVKAIEGLRSSQRREIDLLIGAVVVYDGFSNPLQGWVFRRLMRGYWNIPAKSRPLPKKEYREAEAAAVNVVARKKSTPALCAA